MERLLERNETLKTKYLGDVEVKTYYVKLPQKRRRVIYKCSSCKVEKHTTQSKFINEKKNLLCEPCYQKSDIKLKNMRNKDRIDKIPRGEKSPHWKGDRYIDSKCQCGKHFKAEKRYNGVGKYAKYCSIGCKHRFMKSFHPKIVQYKNIKVRSSWELAFAKYLDNLDITWEYEPNSFKTPFGYYTPDFYIKELDLYIEVKGRWRDDAYDKFNYFSKSHKILLIDKEWLLLNNFILRKDGRMLEPILNVTNSGVL